MKILLVGVGGVGDEVLHGEEVRGGPSGHLPRRAGRAHRSITLEADAKHLLSDVWTSVAVIVAVGVVAGEMDNQRMIGRSPPNSSGSQM